MKIESCDDLVPRWGQKYKTFHALVNGIRRNCK